MLYFQGRTALDVIEALKTVSESKGLARPKTVYATFSQPYLEFRREKEIEGGKLVPTFEQLKELANKSKSVAVVTAIALGFDQWSLKVSLPVGEPWWTVDAHKEAQGPWQPGPIDPWMQALAKALSAVPDKPEVGREPREAREAAAIQIAAAQRMEAVAARISEELEKVAVNRDQALSKRQSELEASYEKKFADLKNEREAFEKEKAERDLRESTVVRRQLLDDTLEALDKESVVLSPETNRKRWTITGALGAAMVIGVGLIVTAIYREMSPTPEKSAEALVLLRSLAVSGIVLFGSALWYFVRWEDRWQQTHATAELQNRKTRKDMLRASWLAELSIEVGKDEKAPKLDPALVEEMSRGLFVAPDEAQVTEHPLEVLFKRARLDRLKFGKTGIELTKRPRPDK